MKRALLLVALVACTADAPLAPTAPRHELTRTDDLPLTVSTEKVKGQTIAIVRWDASLVRTDSVAMLRQNQSTSPTFVRWLLPNTGTFTDTLPKGKTATGYYYWYCEYPAPSDTHCAFDWVRAG